MSGNMKLGVQEQYILRDTLEEKWDYVQSLGYEEIEVRGRGNFEFRERLPELKRSVKAGVVIQSLCPEMSHFIGDFDADKRADALANMKSMISVMSEIGAPIVTTPASWGMFSRRLPPFVPPRSEDDDRKILIENLSILAEHAAEEGVRIVLEPLNRYEDHMVNTLARAVEYCRAVDNPAMGVMGDLYHMNIDEDDPVQALRDALPYLAHMNVNDSGRLEPGTGHFDFSVMLQPLFEAGWDGLLVLECAFRAERHEALSSTARIIRPLIDQANATARPSE